MSRTRSMTMSTAALLLAAPAFLTGCGLGAGDEKEENKSATTSSQASATSNTSSGSESASQSQTSQSDSSGKPSKDEVKTGLTDYYVKQGMPQQSADKFAQCMVDEGYEKFSAKTLTAMKDGKPQGMDPADSTNFTQVSGKCAQQAAGGALPTNLPLPS